MADQFAQLITPEGKVIILQPETYRQVQQLIERTESDPGDVLHKLYGKYAAEPSMTQVLLEERTRDREREEKKLRRKND